MRKVCALLTTRSTSVFTSRAEARSWPTGFSSTMRDRVVARPATAMWRQSKPYSSGEVAR
jgi:hypothetical protein